LQDAQACTLAEQQGNLVALSTPLRGVLQPVPVYRLTLA